MNRANSVLPDAPRRLHLDFIDGIRGVSALYVLLHHVWQFSITDPQRPPPGWFQAASVLKYGSYAVAVFLVVSGYCLMLPVLRHGGTGDPGGWQAFVKRRTRRIVPPYAVALVASMALVAVDPALRRVSLTPWDITLPNFTVGNVASHGLLVHNWFPDWRYGFNPPLWSIGLEFQIYFMFPVLLLPLWRRAGLGAVIGVAFAIAAVPIALGAGYAAPWMLGLFALGIAAAVIGTSDDMATSTPARVPWRLAAVLAVAAIPVAAALSGERGAVDVGDMPGHVVVGVATAVSLIAMSIDHVRGAAPSWPHRLLASRPLRSLGLISYSLYLVHYPIVAAVAVSGVKRYGLDVTTTFAVLLVSCVPISLLAAYTLHVAVERRFRNSPYAPAGSALTTQHDRAAPIAADVPVRPMAPGGAHSSVLGETGPDGRRAPG